MTERERLLISALRHAWEVLNTIRARDGTAYHHNDGMSYFTEEWWDTLTERCSKTIEAISGEPPKPWPFDWELNEADSATLVEAPLNVLEPNERCDV